MEKIALVEGGRGGVLIEDLPTPLPHDAVELISADAEGEIELASCLAECPSTAFWDPRQYSFTAPYRAPRKIWGIGLNYQDHAADLEAEYPEQPASFLKANHTIIGADEGIELPRQSQRVTAEAEIGLVIGKECRNVGAADAVDYVWGITLVLDQTAEDILRENPRYLTRAKNFPTFFCFGPQVFRLDEVLRRVPSLEALRLATVKNGVEERSNVVANMRHSFAHLISFHSQMMPLYPGDIISTGTPGAVSISIGDEVACDVRSIGRLSTLVRGPK